MPPVAVGDGGAGHDVAHPQLAGRAVGEAAPVGPVAGGGRLARHALGTQSRCTVECAGPTPSGR